MKVCEVVDNYYKIFINSLILKKFDFSNEKSLEKFLRNMMLFLRSKYKISLNGLYMVDFFVSEKAGAFICITKTDTVFPYKDIDLKIKIIFNCKFYFKTKKYEILKNLRNVYFYKNNYYIDTHSLKELIKYIELGEIIYDDEFDVENLGIKIS